MSGCGNVENIVRAESPFTPFIIHADVITGVANSSSCDQAIRKSVCKAQRLLCRKVCILLECRSFCTRNSNQYFNPLHSFLALGDPCLSLPLCLYVWMVPSLCNSSCSSSAEIPDGCWSLALHLGLPGQSEKAPYSSTCLSSFYDLSWLSNIV